MNNYVNAGTASATSGSKTVTFAGVSLSLIHNGDLFIQAGDSGIIDTVNILAGTVQLVDNWGGTTSSAAAYTVLTIPLGAELANSTRTIMQALTGSLLSLADMTPSDGDLVRWDAGTGNWVAYSFPKVFVSARNSAGQNVTPATFTKVTLDTEEFDTNNNFASNRFTCTVPGLYHFLGQIRGVSNSGGPITSVAASLYLNGSEARRVAIGVGVEGSQTEVSALLSLAAADYVELFGVITTTSGTPKFDYANSGAGCSRLMVALVRPN